MAVSSGTGALMCCLVALGIGPGDEVIVPGYTFIASISSIILFCRKVKINSMFTKQLADYIGDISQIGGLKRSC